MSTTNRDSKFMVPSVFKRHMFCFNRTATILTSGEKHTLFFHISWKMAGVTDTHISELHRSVVSSFDADLKDQCCSETCFPVKEILPSCKVYTHLFSTHHHHLSSWLFCEPCALIQYQKAWRYKIEIQLQDSRRILLVNIKVNKA